MLRLMTLSIATALLAGAIPAPAVAQSTIGTGSTIGTANIGPADTRSEVAPTLPTPALGEDAPPSAFLRAAQSALIAGRTGETQEALERAQTRLLDRSVPLFQTNNPSENPAVGQIREALRSLSQGDREGASRHIQTAMAIADQTAR